MLPRTAHPLLLLCFLSTLALPAWAQVIRPSEANPVLRTAADRQKAMMTTRAQTIVSAGPDPDTVWVGKAFTNQGGPSNYWNVYSGTYLPSDIPVITNAIWDFDNIAGLQAPDSLMGWWPMSRRYNYTGGIALPDDQRTWWALDHGNVANYVINQHAPAGRTFGVIGMWHDDPGSAAGGVPWTPLAGARSAWCGLRQHADLAVVDPLTLNPFNQDVVDGLHENGPPVGGTQKNFPGYPDQIDQLMYRDIPMTVGQGLAVSFKYRTRMSKSIVTNADTRTGWFQNDPLAVTPGNFISSSAAGANAPQDSFMVYIGVPVDEAACRYSDGVVRPVYDLKRRWFSEVVKVFASSTLHRMFAATGNAPALTSDPTPTASFSISPTNMSNIIAASPGGRVRLVFRVKTNRGFSDSDMAFSLYTSEGHGAVLVDDVTVDTGSGPEVIGDFEAPAQSGMNAIDNRVPLPLGLNTTNVWRTTGRPLPVYMHLEPLGNLVYNDINGPPNSQTRKCDISGLVLSSGNHDDLEGQGDSRFSPYRETMQYAASPTIQLKTTGTGPNAMGITSTMAHVSLEYLLAMDVYTGAFDLGNTGSCWFVGVQSYPAMQANGVECWGDSRFSSSVYTSTTTTCLKDVQKLLAQGLIVTSNASGIPDSIRVFIGSMNMCFKIPVVLGCNTQDGGYFDNIAVGLNDDPCCPIQASSTNPFLGKLGGISSDIWQFVNDTFPSNETAGLPGTAAFDVTTAQVRSGLNIAPATGNNLRFDTPGDSSVFRALDAVLTPGDDPAFRNVRTDLVFRILPGPGNYRVAAGRAKPPGGTPVGVLLASPLNQAVAAVAGDGSFWGQYMSNPGPFAHGSHYGGTGWDPHTWNSARCDTAQRNMFPMGNLPVGTLPIDPFPNEPGLWMTTYHELDPKFAVLGQARFHCFVVDPTKPASSSPALSNVVCDGTLPTWLTAPTGWNKGWDGTSSTKEYTKILPDGLLTPGSHVQYFYRKSHAIDPLLSFVTCPDTLLTAYQPSEENADGHRWQQFAVLPDRWKSSAFGGQGAACVLYLDVADRRGDEGRWSVVMDDIGGTVKEKWGAHNGWHPRISKTIPEALDEEALVHQNNQAGTTWDLYGVKGGESMFVPAGTPGSRLANRSGMGFLAGRESREGPTPEMLRAYYRVIVMHSGDLAGQDFGPVPNRSQDEIALFNDFLVTAAGTAQPRGFLGEGEGFIESLFETGSINPAHSTFATDKLGVVLRSATFANLALPTGECEDLLTTPAFTTASHIFGTWSPAGASMDVLQRNPALGETFEAAYYVEPDDPNDANGPFVANVTKLAVPLRNWIASSSGYDPLQVVTRNCLDVSNAPDAAGALGYYYFMLNQVFGSLCTITGAPIVTLDTPSSEKVWVDRMRLGNSVMRGQGSDVRLEVSRSQRIRVDIHDVAGRRVRSLADRVFLEGEHVLHWDGTDDSGAKVGRGVYFVRNSTQQGSGRVVVLSR